MITRKAGGAVLVLAVVLSGCVTTARPAPTESPTATPTPIVTSVPETPSPTIAPTPDPTRPPTPKPRPTTNRSGLQLLPFYSQARQTFPLLPPNPQIDFDDPAGDEFDAQFHGLNAAGIPMFTVREDFALTPRTAYHEIGHAYEAMLKWKTPSVDWRGRYWSFRGFPGTWQDAQNTSASQAAPPAQWIYSPAESWAEAFSISMVGGGQEKTLDYGRTINPVATKAFFQSLAP